MAGSRDIAGIDIGRPFRVRAETIEDLEVVSAMLQDAIVPISEIAWRRGDNRFVLMTQRFRWEKAPESTTVDDGVDALGDPAPHEGDGGNEDAPALDHWYERITCALRFEHVTAVRANGIDLANRAQMLELLSLHVADGGLDLAFAGNKTIRLTISKLSCHAEDIGQAWPTTQRPEHPPEHLPEHPETES
jgi:hypothetical protein